MRFLDIVERIEAGAYEHLTLTRSHDSTQTLGAFNLLNPVRFAVHNTVTYDELSVIFGLISYSTNEGKHHEDLTWEQALNRCTTVEVALKTMNGAFAEIPVLMRNKADIVYGYITPEGLQSVVEWFAMYHLTFRRKERP